MYNSFTAFSAIYADIKYNYNILKSKIKRKLCRKFIIPEYWSSYQRFWYNKISEHDNRSRAL